MQRYSLVNGLVTQAAMEPDDSGMFVKFSDSADRIERLEKVLKSLVRRVGTSAVCHDWCEALKHEDDPTPNPYCDCGMCELIDVADEAQTLLDELCTCTPSKHYVFCKEDEKCACGDRPKHDDGCAAIAAS